MEKTLQEQYNLIKEGKGDKAYFLKSAYRLFPDMLSQVNSFEDTTRILKNRGVISENIGGLVTSGKKQDWHAIFNENMDKLKNENKEEEDEEEELARRGDEYVQGMEDTKALPNIGSLKEGKEDPSKEVLDIQKHAYDNKDEKNYDNLFGQEFLKGYYTEMKDPKNADKDVEELRAIVAKNLAKDGQYYVKNGQFGVKGLGYQTEAPGLGEPKEPKGKFKSSGYGDLKESKGDFRLWKNKLYNVIMSDAGLDKEDIAVDEFEIKKYWKEGKTPEEVYNNIWMKDAGNFRAIGESFKSLKESVLRSQIHLLIKEVLKEVQRDPKTYADEEEFKDKVTAKLKSNAEAKKYFEKHSAEITKKYFDHSKPEGGVNDAVKYILSKAESNPIHEKKKPSAGLTQKEKSTISKKIHKGKDIGKKGKGFEKVAKAAEKQYGSEEAGKRVAAAAMWKSLAKKK
jgi:hypothetical protein